MGSSTSQQYLGNKRKLTFEINDDTLISNLDTEIFHHVTVLFIEFWVNTLRFIIFIFYLSILVIFATTIWEIDVLLIKTCSHVSKARISNCVINGMYFRTHRNK
jgi:hypothetical protein